MKKNLSGLFIIKKTGIPGITWSQAVDVALCFGWIDSKLLPLNDKQLMQFFCKRKPNSVWSKINKQKVHCLLEEGLMEKAGYTCFYTAKQNGSWVILDKVEELKIPKDLDAAFKTTADSKKYFLSVNKYTRKAILQWIEPGKRSETRQRRINEVLMLAAQKLKPKQFG